ncbi:hypothetical protein PCL_08498 [Purpureocillium lilacinum]|uniref:Uncharacterized protein n=1 Tax=Purpureocillium lilacinum TaxID=33203 RepID=A0A2U3DRL1_PURLI|nr:hypothetical protein Purlil1_5482 [Purpureocillium lilacinum]PWI64865.1 hypothetical protein PCL_08498 [Purpureocillium lilacinum]
MPAANLYPPRPLAQHQLPPARCEMLRAKVRLHVPAAMSRPPAQHDASQKPSTHDLAPRGVAARRRQAVSQPPLTTLLKSKLGATHPHVKCYAELDAPAAGRSWRLWAFGFVPKREKPRSVEPWRRLPRPWLRWSGDAREDGPRCMRATQRPTRRRTGTCVAPSVGDKREHVQPHASTRTCLGLLQPSRNFPLCDSPHLPQTPSWLQQSSTQAPQHRGAITQQSTINCTQANRSNPNPSICACAVRQPGLGKVASARINGRELKTKQGSRAGLEGRPESGATDDFEPPASVWPPSGTRLNRSETSTIPPPRLPQTPRFEIASPQPHRT